MSKSTRERLKSKRRSERIRNIAIGGVIAVAVVAGLTWLATQSRARDSGETVAIPQVQAIEEMPEIVHVAEGTDPGPYNSDPPTSGKHYATQAFADFIDEDGLFRADTERETVAGEGFIGDRNCAKPRSFPAALLATSVLKV